MGSCLERNMTDGMVVEGNPMTCPRCKWDGCTVLKTKYRYVVRWYCSKCGKMIA